MLTALIRRTPLSVCLAAAVATLSSSAAAQSSHFGAVPTGTTALFHGDTGQLKSAGQISATLSQFTLIPTLGMGFRFFDPGTGATAVEVIVAPNATGVPEFGMFESFRIQLPLNPGPVADRALVLGMHSYSSSENQIFVGTDLDQECTDRGWYLLAPLGLTQVNFGNEPSQRALVRVLELFDLFFEFNTDRIYAVGFSMGGGGAVSFAARHLDPAGYRVAGIVNHTGTMDLFATHQGGSSLLQSFMEHPLVFGGTPAAETFAYERVSPFAASGGTVDPERALLSNVAHLPIYLHVNLGDPNLDLKSDATLAETWWTGLGANLVVDQVNAGAWHSWLTLDTEAALDFVGAYSLPSTPVQSLDLYVDREQPYHYTEPRSIPALSLGRYHVDLDAANNQFTFNATKRVDEVAFDLSAMGLSGLAALTIDHASLDATADTIVLVGYPGIPALILVDGVAPAAWSYDAVASELSITPTATGQSSVTVVSPPN